MIVSGQFWFSVGDGNATARSIFDRHYSRIRRAGRKPKLFVGPGEKMVLLTATSDALFVWRKCKFAGMDGQVGVNCAVFRNESPILSSRLILQAEQLAYDKWKMERVFTYVDPTAVASTNPGYCFLMAGWRKCGVTKIKSLIILEKCFSH